MTRLRLLIFFLLSVVAFVPVAWAEIVIEDMRIIQPFGANAVAYGRITNAGSVDDRLIAISTAIAGRSEVHTMEVEDGIARMRPLNQGLVIRAGASVVLMPRGLHLMLLDLKNRPSVGETASITLIFQEAGVIAIEAPVVALGSHQHQHQH